MPRVSIIIPLYNTEEFIEQCIKSIKSQSFTDFECIIIEDGSRDNSVKNAEDAIHGDKRFQLIRQKNTGASATRNRGLELATGEYVMFTDSDDWIEPDTLALALKQADATRADITVFNYRIYNQLLGRFEDWNSAAKAALAKYPEVFSRLDNPDNFIIDSTILIWNKLFYRDFLIKINFSFPTELRNSEDTLAVGKALLQAERITHINRDFYNYRVNLLGSSLGNVSKSGVEHALDHEIALNQLRAFTKKLGISKLMEKGILRAEFVYSTDRLSMSEGNYLVSKIIYKDLKSSVIPRVWERVKTLDNFTDHEIALLNYLRDTSYDKYLSDQLQLYKERSINENRWKEYFESRWQQDVHSTAVKTVRLVRHPLSTIREHRAANPKPKQSKKESKVKNTLAKVNQYATRIIHNPSEGKRLAKKAIFRVVGVKHFYEKALKALESDPSITATDYVFLLSHFARGGSEKVAMNYLLELHEQHPKLRITVVVTDPGKESPWRDALPDYVKFVDFGNISDKLSGKHVQNLFQELIDKLSPRVIHNVNSGVGYYWLGQHEVYLRRNNIKVYASLFYTDISRSGYRWSYYQFFIPWAKQVIDKIFTDNEAIIHEAVDNAPLPEKLFKTHYQPVGFEITPPKPLPKTGKLKILWASRIAWQKRPDILVKIANKLDPSKFEINVYGTFNDGYSEKLFKNSPAIKYHGMFKAWNELPLKDSDIYMYTSMTDGLPNVLLEALGSGLIVVAPDEGGVSEVINDQTGYLISGPTDVDGYVVVLNQIYDTRPDLRDKIIAGQKLLAKRHSAESFRKLVKDDIIIPETSK